MNPASPSSNANIVKMPFAGLPETAARRSIVHHQAIRGKATADRNSSTTVESVTNCIRICSHSKLEFAVTTTAILPTSTSPPI
ncbi:MAG: hypothetical protein HC786_20090 [Richelia sp. CSU_2_1]|nr:hypothetical protein [Microcoleus sp. SM1_3_4]NJR24281.1 hypothetical protein [Richelia sp. CSU_2_1]